MKTRRSPPPGVELEQFLDTADINVGHNEELSKAIQDRRDQVILATKFGNVRAVTAAWA